MIKICHVTSAHKSDDVRIFTKECRSLAEAGYETYLVAQGNSRIIDNVSIVGVREEPKNRLMRMFCFSKHIVKIALKLDCNIYHLHDPELLPYAKMFKKRDKMVVFDSHEDVPAQILSKHWIPKYLRRVISSLYSVFEDLSLQFLDAIVAATEHIGKKYEGRVGRVVVVNNYPRLDDIEYHENSFDERPRVACYVGGVSIDRGETIMKEAVRSLDCMLIIAGDHKVETESNVHYVGNLSRLGINRLFGASRLGLVLLSPTPNYVNSMPVKMFEYMAAGLPFVASNFELWRRIVDKYQCGLCVDPENIEEIQNACNLLLNNPELAQNMGSMGREAVFNDLNWNREVVSLLQLYEVLCQ